MIIICVATDVFPALALVKEQPEADLMLRKPRDRKKDPLADYKFFLQAYAFIGVLESFFSMIGYAFQCMSMLFFPLTSQFSAFWFGFHRRGIPFSALWLKFEGTGIDPDVLAEATNHAQSICALPLFVNLIDHSFSSRFLQPDHHAMVQPTFHSHSSAFHLPAGPYISQRHQEPVVICCNASCAHTWNVCLNDYFYATKFADVLMLASSRMCHSSSIPS
jgi:hypothetical protein